jgi:hypothetical protein
MCITRAFPLVISRFYVVTPSFTHLSITFSYQKSSNCSPTMDVGFWSSHRTVFVEIGCSRWIHIQFCYSVTRAAVIMWFFETALLNVLRSLSVNFDFHSLFLFAAVIFPWFVYAGITLETVALDTPDIVTDFFGWCSSYTRTNDLFPFKIGQIYYFPVLSRGLLLSTITNALAQALHIGNKWKRNIQFCQLKYFQCSHHKQILFLNFLVFPLFRPPLYML